MHILLIILLILGAIIALVLILAAASPSDWEIEAAIVIDKPKADVYDYVKILKNSENFNKWVMTDPGMKKEFKGTDGTVGCVYCWDSENKQVGKGEQEILKLSQGQRIDYEIRFYKPFEGTSYASILFDALSDKQTKVRWTFSSSNTYMMKVMHVALNLKKMLQKDLQTSLVNLKRVLENN